MKYLVTAGETYYAKGGIDDFIMATNSLQEAKDCYDKIDVDSGERTCDWKRLIDLELFAVLPTSAILNQSGEYCGCS